MVSRVTQELVRLDYRPALGRRELPEDSPVRFFFPDPASGSACKRWNLYLRWMVRRDRLDFGLWPGIPTSRLIIPTDTHIHLVSRRLGLTRRKTADGTAARQITRRLARFDPADPVRFDYALCRVGIFGICRRNPRQSRCGDAWRRRGVPGRAAEDRRVKTRTLLALAFAVALASVGVVWVKSLAPPPSPSGSLAFLSAAPNLIVTIGRARRPICRS